MCSDVGDVHSGKSLAEFTPLIEELEEQSFLAGEEHAADYFPCAFWNISSDDRYTGPFGGKTKTPILFVSNTIDPITPIQNGKKGARIFEGAELLTVEGTGHSVSATENKCAYSKINTFFQSGTLPGENNYCALEMGPFNVTLTGPLEKRTDLKKVMNELVEIRWRL